MAISYLTSDSPENRALAASLGLLGDIQAAMQLHPADVAVLEASCGAICQSASGSAAGLALAVELGLLGDLLNAMAAHPSSASLQEASLVAICVIAAAARDTTPLGLQPTMKEYLKQAARAASNNHPQVHGVQKYAAAVIKALS
jgi:hypothetical protein